MIQDTITTIHHTKSALPQRRFKHTTPYHKEISIAYLILVHRFPEQFKRLFRAIYHPNNYYLINVDKKSSRDFFTDIKMFLSSFPNAHIIESGRVVWGGYSMVQTELDGMKYLLDLNLKWDFFINLSGQDFPLRTQTYIHNFLARNKDNNFLKIANQSTARPDTMNRIENHFSENDAGLSDISYKRPFLSGVTSYIGGQWMILTRACCDFICHSSEVKRFEDFYRNTLIADESFFQTVMMNTSFSGHIVNDDKRAIIWIPDGTIKLRPKTFTKADLDFLLTGDNLFARKFDDKVDSNILAMLESTMLADQSPVGHLLSQPDFF